jgi:hypothetical protein
MFVVATLQHPPPAHTPQCFLILFNVITLRNWNDDTTAYFLDVNPLELTSTVQP